ncbi:sugar O-acyltransferase (sialic acid O-acetyltransferase NeuD family) [Flavobacterium sp. 90]|uniref:acetyltransferase n=1 Tax=unclassified Flavobacterium TaxID=196869 RepID=UPI000EAD9038|nr:MULTISPECIES: acetyltransferase [unclassified Flavobacterium]RKR10933.1 sugar O-acyltransferase (sialic acid O-acetyltransferase NeuD family) [Flavobacterium sp. 81]TCK54717.1 sugar O-acyltransferase (sialic acid O-acetyltransferase NeuD family) [Flavobacterium sp. 90]
MKVLAILGSGDLGQQIAHYALSDHQYSKIVFFDDFCLEKMINLIPVIGKIKDVEKAFELKQFDELLIGIGYKHLAYKKKIFEEFKNKIPFGKLIHSTALIDSTALIERGCVIYPGCIIDAKSIIKENVILNIGCTIAHDTIIGAHSFLSPRVAIAGFVTIKEQCFLGINSTIVDNVDIVSKTQIGAGSLVIKSIDKNGLYVGNPVRFVK